MAKLEILHYPDPRLRNVGMLVTVVDDPIRRLVDDMLETMYEAPGIGLAAPQVDVPKRIIVLDISEEKGEPMALINPEIVEYGQDQNETEEGCLSLPGVYEYVQRPGVIRVRGLDRDGQVFEWDAEGLLSVCVQHEIDHLDGKLFIDYLSRLKRKRIRKKAGKLQRHIL